VDNYAHALCSTINAIGDSDPFARRDLELLLVGLSTFSPETFKDKVDLSFMDFHQFGPGQ